MVDRRSVVSQVDSTMAIAERHSGKVPEDQHEAPFLVVHVPERSLATGRLWRMFSFLPSRDDGFFCFGTRVRIQEMGHQKEAYFSRYKAELLVLTCRGTASA